MTEMMNEVESVFENQLPKDKADGLKRWMTPSGMRLGVRPVKGTRLYEVAWETGASLPKSLAGKRYTSTQIAAIDIKDYLSKFWDNYLEEVEKALKKRRVARVEKEKQQDGDSA